MSMTSGTDHNGQAIQERVLDFLKTEPDGRFILTIHTHADEASGELCNSDHPNGTAYYSPVGEVCSYNLGANIISQLQGRKATKGLLLLVCGSAMDGPHGQAARELVTKCVQSIP